jgi:hypothetical protein
MIVLFLSLFLSFLQSTAVTLIVLDDAHEASAGITGYRWVMDGNPMNVKVSKQPPCVGCLERTYNLGPGTHRLTVTPYTKQGDITADTVTLDVMVSIEVSEDGSERTIRLIMRPAEPTRSPKR